MNINQVLPTLVLSVSLLVQSGLPISAKKQAQTLATRSMSLNKRYQDNFVNDVFKDNILLTLHYLNNSIKKGDQPDWQEINKPYSFEVSVPPGKVFAFHDAVLPEFKDYVSKTTNAHFGPNEGFKSDGYLYGDGVCHLASLINWVARDAGLYVVSPVNHNFANIPEVPKEYGVSILTQGEPTQASLMQNLYIKNIFDKPVSIKFVYDGVNLNTTVIKET